MIVKYFADIRKLAEVDEELPEGAPPTLRALLAQLAHRHGPAFEKRVFEGGQLSTTLIVLVNGRNIEHLKGLDTPLGPEDTVAVFPMIAGG
jgi:molybdopterin synthase sulfur carrier subunit